MTITETSMSLVAKIKQALVLNLNKQSIATIVNINFQSLAEAAFSALSIEEQGWQPILQRLANRAAFVMQMLEDDGPKVVPHLIDTDDNPGQYLREAIEEARAFLSSNKREK